MPSYSVTITNGSTTYTADGSATIQPSWEPDYSYEYNTALSPAVIAAVTETWTLRDLVFVSATPSSITSDISTLTTLLQNRTSPVTSVNLVYNGSTVFSLDTTNYAQVTVRGLSVASGPGSLANHWRGTLIVSGRKVRPNGSNEVKLEQRLEESWNAQGLRTETLTGRVEVAPGTSVATVVAGYALTSLGSNFVFTTGGGGADSGGGYNIDYVIENSPTNTVATFRSSQTERGETLPSTAIDYRRSSSFQDSAAGRITTVRVATLGTSTARALTAAQTAKPSTGVIASVEQRDFDALAVTATYTTRAAVPKVATFYGVATLVDVRREVTISGGGQSRLFREIPGAAPFELRTPRRPIAVHERVTVRATNVTDAGHIPLPTPLLSPALMLNDACSEGLPVREEKGESADGDLWSRSADRQYATSDVDAVDFGALFDALYAAPQFDGQPDYPARIAAGGAT